MPHACPIILLAPRHPVTYEILRVDACPVIVCLYARNFPNTVHMRVCVSQQKSSLWEKLTCRVKHFIHTSLSHSSPMLSTLVSYGLYICRVQCIRLYHFEYNRAREKEVSRRRLTGGTSMGESETLLFYLRTSSLIRKPCIHLSSVWARYLCEFNRRYYLK